MNRAYLSIGSNVERERNFRSSIQQLRQLYAPLILSSVYQSPPVGFEGADFFNMAIGLDTTLELADFRTSLRGIEDSHGRRRNPDKLGPRTLDIDLLLFGDTVQHTAQVDLPRGEISRCAFVLLPLSEIAPDLIHPETGQSIRCLWREFDATDQPIARIDFDFESG